MIVSVSRRCDIPRFQFKWFMERLNAGFVETANPFNANQVRRVPLVPREPGMKPEDGVDLFVFWTRDPRNILSNAAELEKRGFPFYVMVTVTGYPNELEPSMINAEKVLPAMKELARIIGPERVIWRYDPVLASTVTDEDFHRENFTALARRLSGSVRRVIVSVYNEYKGAKQRLDALERLGVLQMIDADFAGLFADLAEAARAAGMELQTCASKDDYSLYGVQPGACIDAGLIEKLWGLKLTGKDKNQRPHCLCRQSVDIGSYRICAAHCVYCYAW